MANCIDVKEISLLSPNNFYWINIIAQNLISKRYELMHPKTISEVISINRRREGSAKIEGRTEWYYVLTINNEMKNIMFSNEDVLKGQKCLMTEQNFKSILNQIKRL